MSVVPKLGNLSSFSRPALLVKGLLGLAAFGAVFLGLAPGSSAASLRVSGAVAGPVQYVGQAAATTFTVTVTNSSSSARVGAVSVDVPSGWHVVSCPAAPSGWSHVPTASGCRYASPAGSSGDLRPRATSSSFRIKATTVRSSQDLVGRWRVRAYKASTFTGESTLASPGAASMLTVAYSLQIARVVVASAAPAVGSACPTMARAAHAGSLTTLVVCARNRTTTALTPTSAHSRLGGSFASGGTFSSGRIGTRPVTVVVASWRNARVTPVVGTNRDLGVQLVTGSRQSSPVVRFAGFSATNTLPVAADVTQSTPEDSPVQVALSSADADGDASTFRIVKAPTHGTLGALDAPTCSATASCQTHVLYTPNANVSGPDSFTYQSHDGFGPSAIKTVTLTLTPVNDPPTALDDSASTGSDAPRDIAVLSNDTDLENDALSLGPLDTTGTVGAVTANVDGTVTYDPRGKFATLAPGTSMTDTFRYRASDGTLESAPAVVRVTVTAPAAPPPPPPNTAPSAQPDTGATTQDAPTTISVLSNDSDAEGNPLGVASVDSTGTLGLATINAGGTIAYDPNHAFDYLAAGATATDVFHYRASDGTSNSSPATVTVTVTGTNDAPTNVTLTPATVAENQPSGTTVGTLSTTDKDTADSHTYVKATGTGDDDNDSFTVSGATVSTAAQFDTETKSSYRIRVQTDDGHGGTFQKVLAITVTNVNEAPVVVPGGGASAYTENGTGTALAPGLTLSDVDSTTFSAATVAVGTGFVPAEDRLSFANQNGITGVYDTATGVLTLSGTASLANYGTALQSVLYSNTSDNPSSATRTITFTVKDGALASTPATRDVTVAAVNDAPTVVASAGSASYTEAGLAVLVDSGVGVSDPDSADLVSATLSLTSGLHAGDTLAFVDTAKITHTYSAGVLQLSGTDTVANYQAALASVTFTSTSSSPSNVDRVVKIHVNDGGADSVDVARTVTVTEINSAPVVTSSAGSSAFTAGGPAVAVDPGVTVSDSDSPDLVGATVALTTNREADHDSLALPSTPGITASYDPSTGVLTLSGTAPLADYQNALQSVTFSNNAATPSLATRGVSFVVDDGQSVDNLSAADTARTITVSLAPVPPSVTTSGGATSFTEGDPALTVDSGLTVTDSDSTHLSGATVSITDNFAPAQDALVFVNTATITGSYNSGTGVLTLSGSDTVGAYQTALRAVHYDNTSDNPSTATRTLSFQVTDSSSAASNVATKTITLSGVNDAPALSPAGSVAFTENNTGTPAATDAVAIAPNLVVNDADSPNLTGATVQIGANFQSAEDLLVFANAAPISGTYSGATGLLTLSGTGTLAEYQAALRSVTYRDTSNNPNTSPRTVTFTADDGQPVNHASASLNRTVTVTAFNSLPKATADAFKLANSAVGNTALVVDNGGDAPPDPAGPQKTVTGNIFANDSDVETANASLTATVATTAAHGTVTLEADGDFTYLPTAGCPASSDSFQYTVNDGSGGTATATVTIDILGCVWYVDGSAMAAGNGTSSAPFKTLAGLNGPGDPDGINQTLFLYAGTYTGGLALENGQPLLSQANGLVVPDGAGGAGTVTLEPAGGANATIQGGLVLASGNTVQGIDLGKTGSASTFALSGASVGNAVVNTVTPGLINNPDGGAVSIATGALTMAFSSISSSGSNAEAIHLVSTTGTFTALGGSLSNATSATQADVSLAGGSSNFTYNGTISDDVGPLVSISGESGGTKDFNGAITDVGPGAGKGISLTGNLGATISFDGGLTLDTGSNAAFTATGGGTVVATQDNAAVVNTLKTTTATALNVGNTTIGAGGLTFRSISAGTPASGPASGIVLTNTGTTGGLTVSGNSGTCTSSATCTGGTIQTTTGPGVSLDTTSMASFNTLDVENTAGSGVKGTGLTDFTFTNGRIDNSGTGHGVDDSNIGLNATTAGTEENVKGVVTITGNLLSNAYYQGIDVYNYGGTISAATISNNQITSSSSVTSSLGSGVRLIAFGGASKVASITRATLDSNTITNFPSSVGLQVQGGNAVGPAAPAGSYGTPGSSTDVIEITNNTISGQSSANRIGAEGIIALVNGKGQGNFTISGNHVSNTVGTAISSSAFGLVNVTETIANNVIVANNTLASQGIGVGTGRVFSAADTPSLTSIITNNTISQTDGNGILAVAREANGTLKTKIQNNTVAAPLTGVRQGIRIDAGNSGAGEHDTVCLNITGNTSAYTAGQPGAKGIGLRREASNAAVFGVDGMTGTDVESYVDSVNPAGNGTLLLAATTGFTSCSLP